MVVDTLASSSHNAALNDLVMFLQSVGIEQVDVPSMRCSATGGSRVPVKHAITYFRSVCLVRDVSVLAGNVHVDLIEKISKNVAFNDYELTKVLPNVIKEFGKKLPLVEDLLSTPAASELEASGWQLLTSFATLRVWQRSMAAFRQCCIDTLLREWCKVLSGHVAKANDTCPAWDAFITDSDYQEDLAVKALRGKAGKVVKTHNDLHGVLADLNQVAAAIEVVPKLQTHAITATESQLALHMMAKARATSVIINGVELMSQYRNHMLGPERARAFLKNHPEGAVRQGVPATFWREMENLSKEMPRQVVTSRPEKKDNAPIAVKTEEGKQPSTAVKTEGAGVVKKLRATTVDGPGAKGGLKRRRKE